MSAPSPKKIVIDTNVLIRTTFKKQSPVSQRIYLAIKNQEVILAFSPPILEEIRDVISRDYIIKYTHTTSEMRARYIKSLIDISILTPGTKKLERESRDREDNKFLVCASEAGAQYVVTTDKDLSDMKDYEGIKIIFPQEFVAFLDTGGYK